MKTVGKQLEEARLARNWTPQLASRETKIKVDRLRELETDDYSHFASPTYARGFVRTYARALGLDEYRLLRQLDNKLPDDDSANIVTDTGVAYLPETTMPPRAAHRDYTGLYIVTALGAVVTLAIVFVLFEAYRVGELAHWFASNPEPVAAGTSGTNADGTPASPTPDATARALPVDSNTPPPVPVEATNETNGTSVAAATNATAETAPTPASPRALPVDLSATGGDTDTNSTPSPAAPVQAVRALPVDPSELANATPAPVAKSAPPRALPVDPSELATSPSDATGTPVPALTVVDRADVAPPAVTPPAPATPSARQSNTGPVMGQSLPPVEPSTEPAPTAANSGKPLVLTALQDSFVRVTNLDAPEADKPLFATVLHSGQSIAFNGHKFSINVAIPSAVDIKLDGVNYGPHSDQVAPETFTVESHLP
jgi:cytoskeleton protein RodZ